RRGFCRARPQRGSILLTAARALAGGKSGGEREHHSLVSLISAQSKSAPQNGTNTSCVRPIVMTSIACNVTAAVGRFSLTATTLVLERLGTNRKLRSPPS